MFGCFRRELREKQQVSDVTFLVDDAHHLKNALERLGLRFRVCRYGNRTAVERVFREVKRRTSSFSNTFSNTQLPTAESWLKAFAVWWNRLKLTRGRDGGEFDAQPRELGELRNPATTNASEPNCSVRSLDVATLTSADNPAMHDTPNGSRPAKPTSMRRRSPYSSRPKPCVMPVRPIIVAKIFSVPVGITPSVTSLNADASARPRTTSCRVPSPPTTASRPMLPTAASRAIAAVRSSCVVSGIVYSRALASWRTSST